MKHPVRPAPAPPDPGRGGNYRIQRSATQISKWEDFTREDPFFMNDFNRPKSVPPDLQNSKKKKPPPRPPPPKFAPTNPPTKSNSLLMNLFSRPSASNQSAKQPIRPARRETSTSVVGSLINFNSPPSSPTPTSSSDGVSVNSFGSDGTASHSSFNNHRSRFESGFEDDFDFFGGISSTNVTTPVPPDPWSSTPQDPFSPPRIPVLPKAIPNKPAMVVPKPSVSVKPTIIRAKTAKIATRVGDTNITAVKGYTDDETDWSPPMPSVPPPPLPLEVLQEICPDVPPRPKTKHMETLKKPCGVALYDYNATHPDDLSFHVNDVILLVRAVDEDWLVGQLNGREGMFPANFINVLVPLQPAHSETIVTALYPFTPEAWDDLDFPEGAKIKVLSRASVDWLYGEYAGKSGQFPAAFVDHIPPNLPQRSS